jgi:hypothetical protein
MFAHKNSNVLREYSQHVEKTITRSAGYKNTFIFASRKPKNTKEEAELSAFSRKK